MVTILTPGNQHPVNHNKSRPSRYQLLTPPKPQSLKKFYESQYGKILMGVAAWKPGQYNYDLIHTYNEVPVTTKPWFLTYEDIFPRTFGKYGNFLKKLVRQLTLQKNCIKLISLSHYGVKKTEFANRGWSRLSEMMQKVEVIPPIASARTKQPKKHNGQTIRLVFCGNAFARKGGIVALRLAKLAHESNFPLHIDLISRMGFDDYTDFMDRSRYEPDLKLCDLPNVTCYGKLPNEKVIELLTKSDFQLMATLHDTYGYSILEGFSVGTPAIVTATCALPEFVRHEENGFLLQVEVNENNDIKWIKPSHEVAYRLTDEYWEHQDRTFDDLARQAFNLLQSFLSNSNDYERLSQNAIMQITQFHDARLIATRLDDLYDEALCKN